MGMNCGTSTGVAPPYRQPKNPRGSEMFFIGTRLQIAATSLDKIIDNEELDSNDKENLAWTGYLMSKMDINISSKSDVADLTCLGITEARPYFYDAFKETEFFPDTEKYLPKIYTTLDSSGIIRDLSDDELRSTKKLMELMSKNILEDY